MNIKQSWICSKRHLQNGIKIRRRGWQHWRITQCSLWRGADYWYVGFGIWEEAAGAEDCWANSGLVGKDGAESQTAIENANKPTTGLSPL